jgi:hypothetical protein
MLRIVARDSRRAGAMPRRSPLHQGDARALDRDVRAGAHGDADIGPRRARGVVDAVAGHGDDDDLRLEPLHHVDFLIGGSKLGEDSSMPRRAATARRWSRCRRSA